MKKQDNKYQNTLNLPDGSFPMRAGLPKKEPERLKQWYDEDLYGKIRTARKGAEKFILHDGPPYANGAIHTGTALTKMLKDFVVKFKTMQGFDAPFIPGWDCHGLPVEKALLKELNKTKHEVDQVDFRKGARKYAKKFLDLQRSQFKRLGTLGEWDNPYITMDNFYEADIVRAFGELYEKNYIFRGLKPIQWCPTCETALANAEVEYADHSSPSVFVKFSVKVGEKLPFENCKNPNFLIWTTTPWTLPANRAVCLNPNLDYCAVNYDGSTLILAEGLLESLFTKLETKVPEILGKCKGKVLEGILVKHPIDHNLFVPIILGQHVTLETGTGCVHTAPGHGHDDYIVGLNYNLEIFSPVDARGHFTDEVPLVKGMFILKGNKIISEFLENNKTLLLKEKISHSYPHCWRCEKPLIFRATEQWFLGVDTNDMRNKALKEIENIKWVPEIRKHRISSMVENRPDWCLSRQRLWGVPIPVFYCEKCGNEKLNPEIAEHFAKLVEKDSSDIWFSKNADELLPDGVVCEKCGCTDFKKDYDILDVWFDSGISHKAVIDRRKELTFPADLYFEGSDQHRGWFQVSLLTSIGLKNVAPYKTVVTNGWTLAESGEKESKSKGNYTDPVEVCEKMGADILRLWAGSVNYMQDMMVSHNLLKQVADEYRRIRNTFKYLLGNIHDFNPENDSVSYDDLLDIDKYMLHNLELLREKVINEFDDFKFYHAIRLIHNFCAVDLSSRYCDILKDRLYAEKADGLRRRSAQTVLRYIAEVLTKLLAPVLAFTTEEVWEYLNKKSVDSIHLSLMPLAQPNHLNPEIASDFDALWKVRDDVLKILETKRQNGDIGSSLEAAVALQTDDENLSNLLNKYLDDLPACFIVSQVEINREINDGFSSGHDLKSLNIYVRKAAGGKCARCWNYSKKVEGETDLCPRCLNVVAC